MLREQGKRMKRIIMNIMVQRIQFHFNCAFYYTVFLFLTLTVTMNNCVTDYYSSLVSFTDNHFNRRHLNSSSDLITRRGRALRPTEATSPSINIFTSPPAAIAAAATARQNNYVSHGGYNGRDAFHKSLQQQQQQQKQSLLPSMCQFVFNSSHQMTGNFSSPSFGTGSYPANSRCTYLFVGSRYQVLNITFHTFQLESPFTKG